MSGALARSLGLQAARACRGLGSLAQVEGTSISEDVTQVLKDKALLTPLGFVGNDWVGNSRRGTFDVLNPATADVIATLPNMGGHETRAAIAAAAAAWPSWGTRTGKQRSAVLRRWYELVLAAEDDIAAIMTLESGKPLAESHAEFTNGVASIEWFAEQARRVDGDILQPLIPDKRCLIIKQPVGVAAAITPWNFPFSMITRKASPGIAAGCPIILKPAEATPLTALALAELAQRAGMPPGVFNVVVGDPVEIGNKLMESEAVRKIGFTGSTRVGKMLMAQAAQTVKRVSMELGGNAPFIVFDDADLEQAAKGVVASAFRNAGQTCICANRIFVQAGIHDDFLAAVKAQVERLKPGSGLDPKTTLGPLINAAAVERVAGHVSDAVAKGAEVLVGGGPMELPAPYNKGFFHPPTVLAGATPDMRIFREETFGPAMPVFRFGTEAEAIQLANNTEYGLASYFFTKDLARAWKVAEQLEYGMCGVNDVAITSEVAPFGGIKESGLGREHSKYGMDEFLYLKYIQMHVG